MIYHYVPSVRLSEWEEALAQEVVRHVLMILLLFLDDCLLSGRRKKSLAFGCFWRQDAEIRQEAVEMHSTHTWTTQRPCHGGEPHHLLSVPPDMCWFSAGPASFYKN
jgi:hypothetical protein